MRDRIRLRLFFPVARLLWRIEEGARWLGNLFEDFAVVDYSARRAKNATPPDQSAGESG